MFKRQSYLLVWAALSAPVVVLSIHGIVTPGFPGHLFYWTGVLSVWLAFVTIVTTPLMRLAPKSPFVRWLFRNRRYIGVASFAYVFIHFAVWVYYEPLRGILISFTQIMMLTGWISFFIFAAMAITSNDLSVRKMGTSWKKLQRWTYIAIPLGLLHWFLAVHWKFETVLLYGGLFIVVMGLRMAIQPRSKRSPS